MQAATKPRPPQSPTTTIPPPLKNVPEFSMLSKPSIVLSTYDIPDIEHFD
jgi:hypothetical protein